MKNKQINNNENKEITLKKSAFRKVPVISYQNQPNNDY